MDKCILSIKIKKEKKRNVRICECEHLNTQVVTARQISVLIYEPTFLKQFSHLVAERV